MFRWFGKGFTYQHFSQPIRGARLLDRGLLEYHQWINRGVERVDIGKDIITSIQNINQLRLSIVWLIIPLASVAQGQDCVPEWDNAKGMPGVSSIVNAVATYNDGRGEAIYVGGRFTTAGNTIASKIAKWNGHSWSALGSGIGGFIPAVNMIAVYQAIPGDVLIVGGQFDTAGGITANNVAQWDGNAWNALETGTNDSVFAGVTYLNPFTLNEDFIIGGSFTTAGGVSVNQIAGWDGQQWYALGEGLNGEVLSLAVYDDGSGGGSELYASGSFSRSGEVTVRSVAKWDGESWLPLGNGVSGRVFAMTVYDDGSGPALFVGGEFARADANNLIVNHIAKWDGVNWSALGNGTSATVRALSVFDDGFSQSLFAGGTFTTAGVVDANRIAKWNSISWSSLGDGLSNPVFAMTRAQQISSVGPALYVGGSFQFADQLPANFMARWTGCFDRPGDFDGDGDTDLDDYFTFQSCILGPDVGVTIQCDTADFDLDGDVDLRDAAIFQNFFITDF